MYRLKIFTCLFWHLLLSSKGVCQ